MTTPHAAAAGRPAGCGSAREHLDSLDTTLIPVEMAAELVQRFHTVTRVQKNFYPGFQPVGRSGEIRAEYTDAIVKSEIGLPNTARQKASRASAGPFLLCARLFP